MAWVVPAVGLAISAYSAIANQMAADKRRKAEAAKEKYSWATGEHGQMVEDPNTAGTVAGGLAGAYSQFKANQEADKWAPLGDKYREWAMKKMDADTGGSSQAATPPPVSAPPVKPPPSSLEAPAPQAPAQPMQAPAPAFSAPIVPPMGSAGAYNLQQNYRPSLGQYQLNPQVPLDSAWQELLKKNPALLNRPY